jgi:plastocyanin
VDEMNFPLGVIIIVGVLAAIILGLIASSPDDIIQPRIVSDEEMEIKSEPTTVTEPEPEEDLTVCTMQWDPMCGIDGETYGNLCMLDAADVKLDYEGECVTAEPEAEPEAETLPMSQTISIPEGVGVPGCETTTECYLPYEVDVAVGATVTWSNDDIAVHTVTSGNPSSGVDELFDSSIFMSGDSFEFTFNDAGTFDYFCMVHPWMAGIVNVS